MRYDMIAQVPGKPSGHPGSQARWGTKNPRSLTNKLIVKIIPHRRLRPLHQKKISNFILHNNAVNVVRFDYCSVVKFVIVVVLIS